MDFGKINQWDKIKSPYINPHKYNQVIFNKEAKDTQWEKDGVFNKWYWKGGGILDWHVHTAVFKMSNQQGPTI